MTAASTPTSVDIAAALVAIAAAGPAVAPAPALITKKKLSKWGITGLDITDAGFSKLHSKEQTFEESSRKHYNLEKTGFLNYANNLVEKVKRIYAK